MSELLDRIRGALVGLKMPRALEALDHTMQQLEKGEITAIEAIDGLLSEEYATRETRRIDVALRTAKLLPVKTLESFDFGFQPSLDRERIAALAQLDFIRRAEVVHFLGPPGTGKSHLATALGVAAVKAGKGVYLEFPRFRGHPMTLNGRCHHAENQIPVPCGFQGANRGPSSGRAQHRGTREGVRALRCDNPYLGEAGRA